MRPPQLSLSRKIVLLITAPALVQLGIAGTLIYMEGRMQAVNDRAEKARLIKDAIGKLINERYRVIGSCDNKSLIAVGLGSPLFSKEQSALYLQVAVLNDLVKDSPADLATVKKSERAGLQAMAILHQLKEMYDQGNIYERAETKPLVAHLRRVTLEVVSPDLVDLSNRESFVADGAPVEARHLRRLSAWILGLGTLISSALWLGAAWFLLRGVALRVNHLLDETAALSQKYNLQRPAMAGGGDEITRLEATFDGMARNIDEITAKQTALMESAGDMICTLDQSGKISGVNSEGGRLFGCHQADLIDKHYRDLVHKKDSAALSDYLERTRAGSSGKAARVRCLGKGKRTLLVNWSAHWSAADGQYLCVVHDLTQALEAQLMKQEIVGFLTRDLKAPMTNLQEFFELLEEGSVAKIEDRGRRLVAGARHNADHMLNLVNDLIDLEKAKGGLLAIDGADVALDKIIDAAQIAAAPLAEAKNVVLDCRKEGLSVKGEEAKLLRVMTTLLVFGVERSPADTAVLLMCKSQDGSVLVTITDRGKVLGKEQLGTIFDAYSSAGCAVENPGALGPGLGLAMCKAFIEMHGGTVAAASKDGETVMTISLPLASTSGAQRARVT